MSLPPRFARISDYVAWFAKATPEAEAAVLGDLRISFAELDRRVDALAKALIAHGVVPGDRVATLQAPSPDFLVAMIATASIGAIWAGLNPKYRQAEMLHLVTDCGPRVLLARRHVAGRDYDGEIAAMQATAAIPVVATYDGDMPGMPAFLAAGDRITDAALAAHRAASGGRAPCLLVYTSGTTGIPKGALLHQQGIIDFALAQNCIWPVAPNRILNYFPINHVGCTVDLAIPCLVSGGCTIFMEQFDPGRALDLMVAEGVTFWGAVPAVFTQQLAELASRPRDLSTVRLIVWEGAAISEAAFDSLAAFGVPMATNYGQTESTSAICCVAPSTDRDLLLHSVGPAFPGVEVRLAGSPPDGEPGEVLVRSRYMFIGYWNRHEASAEAFTDDGFLKTGDLAVRRPDGCYRIVGRCREMFKSGGYNVYPREVEAALEAHPAVAQAVVVAVPDPMWQEIGVAFLTLRAPVDVAELAAHARDRLANYKVPKRFCIETELPLLPVGKVDRTALRNRAEAQAAGRAGGSSG